MWSPTPSSMAEVSCKPANLTSLYELQPIRSLPKERRVALDKNVSCNATTTIQFQSIYIKSLSARSQFSSESVSVSSVVAIAASQAHSGYSAAYGMTEHWGRTAAAIPDGTTRGEESQASLCGTTTPHLTHTHTHCIRVMGEPGTAVQAGLLQTHARAEHTQTPTVAAGESNGDD